MFQFWSAGSASPQSVTPSSPGSDSQTRVSPTQFPTLTTRQSIFTGCPKSLFTPFFRRQWPLKGRFQMIFPYIWALPESLEQGALHATHLFSI